MRRIRLKAAGLAAVLVVVIVLLGIAFRSWLREEKTWTVKTQIGDRRADVAITWISDRALIAGHVTLLGGGNWEYITKVTFQDGQQLTFETENQPRAIWRFDGTLYVACCGPHWRIYKIDEAGNLRAISKKGMPDGPRPWNLEARSEEVQKQWDEDFELWAP